MPPNRKKGSRPFLHPPGSQPDLQPRPHQFVIKLTVEEALPIGETAPRCCARTCTTPRLSVPPRFVPVRRFSIRHGGRQSSRMIGVSRIGEGGKGDAYLQIIVVYSQCRRYRTVQYREFYTVPVPGKHPECEAVLEDWAISCCDGYCINSGTIFEHFLLPFVDHLG